MANRQSLIGKWMRNEDDHLRRGKKGWRVHLHGIPGDQQYRPDQREDEETGPGRD
jgi:hypothetical protein